MINLAVINLKSLIKNIVKIIIIAVLVIVIFLFLKFAFTKTLNDESISTYVDNQDYIKIMEKTFSLFSYGNIEIEQNTKNEINKILASEIKLLSNEDAIMEKENQEEITNLKSDLVSNDDTSENNIGNADAVDSINNTTNNTNINNSGNDNIDAENFQNLENNADINSSSIYDIKDLPKVISTSVINDKNLTESYNVTYGSVKIKNESKYTLTDEILTPDVDYSNKSDILIFHTHTCESYTQTEENSYETSGNFRTTDLEHSVAKVGSVLTSYLQNLGYNVTHSVAYHDYPAYTGSYTRSMSTVKSILETNSTIENVIDLHRDAVGSDSSYGPTVKIGDEVVAQIMFVIGTDGGGLNHPNWQQNLKLAVKVQEKANEMYPGLFRPIIVRNSRYNQNLAKGACIIEVGATGNTLEECMGSMKYLAKVISEVMK
jgi:stage II sporulation protein P